MEVKTKFCTGDFVFFMTNSLPQIGRIEQIHILLRRVDSKRKKEKVFTSFISYDVKDEVNNKYELDEFKLFATKEELIKTYTEYINDLDDRNFD
ncbi:MAG: hypothetical protein IKR17_03655 [Bacteroidales bacterium]|nr:hypothetical protein [Bacteroidales bacterium]